MLGAPKTGRLVLREGSVARAYLVSPVAVIAALWFCLNLAQVARGEFNLVRSLLLIPWLFMLGIPVCIVVELVIVAPILSGFRRYGWRWVNGWSACILGFVLGAAPMALLAVLNELPSRPPWTEALPGIALYGLPGLVGAIVFRLIAFKRSR